MDFSVITTFLSGLAPWVPLVFKILGALVVIATVVDQLWEKVNFMDKVFNIPILGSFLSFITRFSPLNVRDQK